MQPFTFIHAADLHLDAVLPGAGGKAGAEGSVFAPLLAGAVFIALERLTELCIERQAAFLLLSGDVFHAGSGSLKANFALRDACMRLAEHGIDVFWARGNHDPASNLPQSMDWPDNLHIFGSSGDIFTVNKNGAAIALVQGASHGGSREKNNLAKMLQGQGKELPLLEVADETFKIGVLHCAVRGKSGKHDNYAPCALEDLQGNSYWALGHVHERSVLSSAPLVVYPGSLQGLHINEDGAHGCYVARVDSGGKVEISFAPLAPLRWEKLQIDLGGLNGGEAENAHSLDWLEEEALSRLEREAARIAADPCFAPVQGLVFRMELIGRSALNAVLRHGDNLADFTARLNVALARRPGTDSGLGGMETRLKDIALKTTPDVDVEALLQSGNLVGETLRQAKLFVDALAGIDGDGRASCLEHIPADIAGNLRELYADKRLQQYLREPDAAQLADLAREAASLCLDLFEVE